MFRKSKSKKIHTTNSALASKSVYQHTSEERNQYIPEGFIVDSELSSKKILTLVNPETKEVISAFRGTQTAGDWKQNVGMGIGLETYNKDYKRSLKNTKKVQEKYKDYNITLTGHSKGSRNALSIGEKLNMNVEAFDGPTSLLDLHPHSILYNNIKKNPKANIHSTLGDPVGAGSLVAGSGNKNIIIAKGLNPHTIDNHFT
jgi:hypothetical protein